MAFCFQNTPLTSCLYLGSKICRFSCSPGYTTMPSGNMGIKFVIRELRICVFSLQFLIQLKRYFISGIQFNYVKNNVGARYNFIYPFFTVYKNFYEFTSRLTSLEIMYGYIIT